MKLSIDTFSPKGDDVEFRIPLWRFVLASLCGRTLNVSQTRQGALARFI